MAASFNGAASLKTRKSAVPTKLPTTRWSLQWGRVPEDAEIFESARIRLDISSLQWGRVPEDAEIAMSSAQPYPVAASMGPRP